MLAIKGLLVTGSDMRRNNPDEHCHNTYGQYVAYDLPHLFHGRHGRLLSTQPSQAAVTTAHRLDLAC